jgi:hypothetical protein
MKIRTITCSLVLSPADFHEDGVDNLADRFDAIKSYLEKTTKALSDMGYEVQTIRIATNSFETWMLPSTLSLETIINRLDEQLARINVGLCAIGASTKAGLELIPRILAQSERLSASVLFSGDRNDVSADCDLALVAAGVALELVEKCGVLGNFRFCTSFNCKSGTPFFPAAYSDEAPSSSSATPSLSVGLENGDGTFYEKLLFKIIYSRLCTLLLSGVYGFLWSARPEDCFSEFVRCTAPDYSQDTGRASAVV